MRLAFVLLACLNSDLLSGDDLKTGMINPTLVLRAEQGDARAQLSLGLAYYSGQEIEKDPKQAFKWIRLSAEQKDAVAQRWLGTLYTNGQGVSKDLASGYVWITIASQNGDDTAYRMSGDYKLKPGDLKRAKRLYAANSKYLKPDSLIFAMLGLPPPPTQVPKEQKRLEHFSNTMTVPATCEAAYRVAMQMLVANELRFMLKASDREAGVISLESGYKSDNPSNDVKMLTFGRSGLLAAWREFRVDSATLSLTPVPGKHCSVRMYISYSGMSSWFTNRIQLTSNGRAEEAILNTLAELVRQ